MFSVLIFLIKPIIELRITHCEFPNQLKTVTPTLMYNLYCVVAACRSVNTVLQKQLTEEKDSKEQILRDRDQLAQVRTLPLFLMIYMH